MFLVEPRIAAFAVVQPQSYKFRNFMLGMRYYKQNNTVFFVAWCEVLDYRACKKIVFFFLWTAHKERISFRFILLCV